MVYNRGIPPWVPAFLRPFLVPHATLVRTLTANSYLSYILSQGCTMGKHGKGFEMAGRTQNLVALGSPWQGSVWPCGGAWARACEKAERGRLSDSSRVLWQSHAIILSPALLDQGPKPRFSSPVPFASIKPEFDKENRTETLCFNPEMEKGELMLQNHLLSAWEGAFDRRGCSGEWLCPCRQV